MDLLTGGGLKDGWSYLMPSDNNMLYEEVSCVFADELEEHVKEQTEAIKNLYLSSRGSLLNRRRSLASSLVVEEIDGAKLTLNENNIDCGLTFVVKRGLQVLGCATLHEDAKKLTDLVVVPSAKPSGYKALIEAAKAYAQKAGFDTLSIVSENREDAVIYQDLGFEFERRGSKTDENSVVQMVCKIDVA